MILLIKSAELANQNKKDDVALQFHNIYSTYLFEFLKHRSKLRRTLNRAIEVKSTTA